MLWLRAEPRLSTVCRRPRKMMPTDPIQAMEFAQSKGQARKEGKTGITFGDIAGMEATKQELQEVVEVGMRCLKADFVLSTVPSHSCKP